MKKVYSYVMIMLMMLNLSLTSCQFLEEPPPPKEPWKRPQNIPFSVLNDKDNKVKLVTSKNINKLKPIEAKFESKAQKDLASINEILGHKKLLSQLDSKPNPFYEKLLTKNEAKKKVSLAVDFNKVSLNDLIVPFAQILKFSYIIDPAIKGEISLKIDQKMSKREIFQLLQQLLVLSDCYASVDDNKLLKIIPLEKITKDNQLTRTGLNGCVAKVVHLNHISSSYAIKALKNQLKPDANVIELSEQNSLLLVDDTQSVARIEQILRLVDQGARQQWSTMVFNCPTISATRLKKELEQILPILGFAISTGNATNTKKANAATKNVEVDLLALDRLDLLMITAVTDEALNEISNWVDVLNREDIGDAEQIFVYPIVNSRASELVQALSVIFTTDGKSMASEGANSGLSGSNGQKGYSSSGSTQSTSIDNNNGKEDEDGFASTFDIPVHIFSDEINNRLIIRTTPKTYSVVKALLNRIDTAPTQVLLQVLIVEVALTKSTEFGVRFNNLNSGSQVLSEFGTNYEGLDPSANNNYGFTAAIANPNNPDEQFAFLKALANRSRVKVISSPQVLVENHAEAKISVGDKVPIVQSEVTNSQSVQFDDSTALLRKIQYIDTGVILNIKPTITKGGLIRVDLDQTISLATQTKSSGIDSPTISERILKTKMSLRNQQTFAIGGLIRETEQQNQSTIPGISEIPVLSWLAGDNSNTIERTELILLLTGTIIEEETKLQKIVRRYADAVNEIRKFEYELYHRDDIREKEEKMYRNKRMPYK
ncbi:secretin N-terminal domain-containing protein [Lentisphaerota bacterium WC36G]|nr:hypothetical protein LJT99_02600 [Lentisphaerae bacterium WC36]